MQGLQPLSGHHCSPSILTDVLGKSVPLTTWEMPPSARGRTAPHVPTTVPTGLLIRGAQGVEYRLMDRGSLKKTKHRHIFPTKIKMTVSYTEEVRATSWRNRHAKKT